MSKEVNKRRYATGTVTPEPGAPYRKLPNAPHHSHTESSHNRNRDGGVVAASSSALSSSSPPAPTAAGARQGPPRLTINNYVSFNPRVKKLPPDANTKAAVNTKLYQFPEQLLFACAKCRRDRIQSDSVAMDPKNKIILCTACFTRIVRPRTYRPSRVVPFPSLLSWLNYKPSKVEEVSDDVMARPAEAVAPSGNRMALPMLANGDRPTSLEHLPAVAMTLVPAVGATAAASAPRGGDLYAVGAGVKGTPDGKHPCLRVWGVCQHAETCLFRNAPADLCLAYLMGLCRGDGSDKQTRQQHSGGRRPRPCHLLHQKIYDLPRSGDPCPPVRYIGEIEGEEELDGEEEEEESPWIRWIARHRNSPNSAEWQLWNNGALKTLFDVYIPAIPRPIKAKPKKPEQPKVEEKVEEAEEANGEEEKEKEPTVKLNLNDILSGLQSINK